MRSGGTSEHEGAPRRGVPSERRIGAVDGARCALLETPGAMQRGQARATEEGRAELGHAEYEIWLGVGAPARCSPLVTSQLVARLVPRAEHVAHIEDQ